jgi:hypothetical protein
VASRSRHDGARIGGTLSFGRRTWTVVGIIDGGGSAFDSEIWADVGDVQDDARRPSGCSGIRLRIAPGADRQALIDRIAGDARVTLEAKPETVYYAEQADAANSLYILVLVLAVIMATGATFGRAQHDVRRSHEPDGRDRHPPRARLLARVDPALVPV